MEALPIGSTLSLLRRLYSRAVLLLSWVKTLQALTIVTRVTVLPGGIRFTEAGRPQPGPAGPNKRR